MIGPALVRQEPGEAAANVGKRLEFIGGAAASSCSLHCRMPLACSSKAACPALLTDGVASLLPAAASPLAPLPSCLDPAGELRRLDGQLAQLEEKQGKKQAQVRQLLRAGRRRIR